MHILLFTPYFNQPRGNATTSKRIVHFLQKKGIQPSVFPYLEKDLWHLPKTDLVHVLHATRFVQWAIDHDYTLSAPYIVTMGGTDINHDLQTKLSDKVFQFLDKSAYITVFTRDAMEKVAALHPQWVKKTVLIPQAAWISWKIQKQKEYLAPHILLPAGLRPVKDVLHVIPALDQLVGDYPDLTFTLLGANLDDQVYQQVMDSIQQRPWMTYAGVVPFEVMTQWYNEANIIINTSISEGQSLAVMEAMAMGRPVVARRNAANEALIRHEETGWLYDTMEDFRQAIHSIMRNGEMREEIIHQARDWAVEYYAPEQEANEYIKLYERAGI